MNTTELIFFKKHHHRVLVPGPTLTVLNTTWLISFILTHSPQLEGITVPILQTGEMVAQRCKLTCLGHMAAIWWCSVFLNPPPQVGVVVPFTSAPTPPWTLHSCETEEGNSCHSKKAEEGVTDLNYPDPVTK